MRSIVRACGVNRRGPPTCDAETWHMIDCHLTFAFAELTRFLAASLSVISTACRGHEWPRVGRQVRVVWMRVVWMRVVCAVLVIMSGVGRWTGGSVWLCVHVTCAVYGV